MMLSTVAMATAPTATMESNYGNISIVFSNFGDATNNFEKYQCHIDAGWSYRYVIDATAVAVDGETKYKCLDQGILSTNVEYDVYMTFETWPSDYVSQSPSFKLTAD